MKRNFLKISLLSILFFPNVALADGPRAPEGAAVAANDSIQLQAEDKVHLCVKNNADAALFHPNPLQPSKGVIITLENAGTHLFTPGERVSIANGGNSENITVRNREDGVYFTNADLVYIQDQFDILSRLKLLNIFDRNDDFNPYFDLEISGNNHIPCSSAQSNTESFKINAVGFLLHITNLNLQVPEENPELGEDDANSGANSDGDVLPPADEAPVLPEVNAVENGGGCSMSHSTQSMNLGVGLFFALILGTHALFRFRKE